MKVPHKPKYNILYILIVFKKSFLVDSTPLTESIKKRNNLAAVTSRIQLIKVLLIKKKEKRNVENAQLTALDL